MAQAEYALPVGMSLAAMCVNGAFGGAVARTRDVPIIGTLLAGVIVGVGGGMVRDVLLGQEPIAISTWYYIPAVTVAALVGALFAFHLVHPRAGYLITQGLALGLLITIGAQTAIDASVPVASVILLAMLTASAGGVITDAMTNHRTAVMTQSHWFATALFFGSVLFWALSTYVNFYLATVATVLLVVALRFFSVSRDWSAPAFPPLHLDSPSRTT